MWNRAPPRAKVHTTSEVATAKSASSRKKVGASVLIVGTLAAGIFVLTTGVADADAVHQPSAPPLMPPVLHHTSVPPPPLCTVPPSPRPTQDEWVGSGSGSGSGFDTGSVDFAS